MAFMKYNYTAAFVAYCNGTPVDEIAMVLGIPEETLKTKVREERWSVLQEKLPLATQALAEQGGGSFAVGVRPEAGPLSDQRVTAKMELMIRNREENYQIACQLREDLKKVVSQLVSEEGLTLEKQWHFKGDVVRAEVPVTLGDRVNLATYARTIADLTYQALGDKTAATGAKEDGPAGSNTQAPGITIILPGAVAAPRAEREVEGQVIDLRPAGDSTPKLPGI